MCKGGCRKSILERIYGLFAVPTYSPFPLQDFLVNYGGRNFTGTIPLAWPPRSSCLLCLYIRHSSDAEMTPTSLPTVEQHLCGFICETAAQNVLEVKTWIDLFEFARQSWHWSHEKGHFCGLLNAPVCSTQFGFSDQLQRHYLSLNQMHVASGNYFDESVIRQISATLHAFPW